jgi:hypothetical protein
MHKNYAQTFFPDCFMRKNYASQASDILLIIASIQKRLYFQSISYDGIAIAVVW